MSGLTDPFALAPPDAQGGDLLRNLATLGASMATAANARTASGHLAYGTGLAGPLGAGVLAAQGQGLDLAKLRSALALQGAQTQGATLDNQLKALGLPAAKAGADLNYKFLTDPAFRTQWMQQFQGPSDAGPAQPPIASDAIPPDQRGPMLASAVAGTPIPPHVMDHLVTTESGWRPGAVNDTSKAYGLVGALPSTAAEPGYGLPPLPANASPTDQLRFGAQYLHARGKALGMTDADWQNPAKVREALAAYHGPATDANGVNGQEYSQRVAPDGSFKVVQAGTGPIPVPSEAQGQNPRAPVSLAPPQPPAPVQPNQQALARASMYEQQANMVEMMRGFRLPVPGDPAALRQAAQAWREFAFAGAKAGAAAAAELPYAGPKAAATAGAELPAKLAALGFRQGPNGLAPIPGGMADPAYVGQKAAAEAAAKVVPELAAKGFKINADGTMAPIGGGPSDPALAGATAGAQTKAKTENAITTDRYGNRYLGTRFLGRGSEVKEVWNPDTQQYEWGDVGAIGPDMRPIGASGLPASVVAKPGPVEAGRMAGAGKFESDSIDHDRAAIEGDLSHVIENTVPAKQQLFQLRGLVDQAAPGAAGQFRANFKNWVQTFAPDFVSQITGDASPAQEFNKIALMGAGKQERGDLGARGGFRAIELYVRANPNLDMQPTANHDMANALLVSHQFHEDYATGATNFYNKNTDAFTGGGKYTPVSRYDNAFIRTMRPELYAAAISALNGKPYAQWSKGLTVPQLQIVGGILKRTDPSASVDLAGQRVPVTSFASTIEPADIMQRGAGNAP